MLIRPPGRFVKKNTYSISYRYHYILYSHTHLTLITTCSYRHMFIYEKNRALITTYCTLIHTYQLLYVKHTSLADPNYAYSIELYYCGQMNNVCSICGACYFAEKVNLCCKGGKGSNFFQLCNTVPVSHVAVLAFRMSIVKGQQRATLSDYNSLQ